MNERWLIINADDLGMRPSVNEAVDQLFAAGRITSASLMATAGSAAAAADRAVQAAWPVGVHWTLQSDWAAEPWLSIAPAIEVPSLLSDGFLPVDSRQLARTARSREITRELSAQADFLISRKCKPDHADSHGGTLYGLNGRLFFINAFRLCRRLNLPFRLPRSDRFLSTQFGKPPAAPLRAAHAAIVFLARRMGVSLLDDMITNPWPVERIARYEDLRDFYLREVAASRPGITEMFLHPAWPDPAMARITPQWRKREWEMRFLLEPELFELIEHEGIRLTNWHLAPFQQV